MDYINIDKNSDHPLHIQLSRCIREAIRANILMPGTKLPTEEELVARFDLSRPVIRQAYRQLMDEQLIYRYKGKGTYVRLKEVNYNMLQSLLPLSQKIKMIGLELNIEMLSQSIIDYDPSWMGQLELSKGDQVLLTRRIYHGDGAPIFFVEMVFPLKMFPGLDQIDVNQTSMYDAVRENFDARVSHVNRTLTAVILSDEICDIFNLPHGSAGFRIESLVLTHEGRPVELSINYLKGIGASVSIDYFKQLKL